MDAIQLFVEVLKQKGVMTELQKDIVNTWDEIYKHPFDMTSANNHIAQIYSKYNDLYGKVNSLPTTSFKDSRQIKDYDLKYILSMQLGFLYQKEMEEQCRGK